MRKNEEKLVLIEKDGKAPKAPSGEKINDVGKLGSEEVRKKS